MSCHCGETTERIQPSVASGILPCMARSAATMVLVLGNSETGFGHCMGREDAHNTVSAGPGNGFCFAPIRLNTVLAMSAFDTGSAMRIPGEMRPGQEIIKGTRTRPEYRAAPCKLSP